MNLLRTIRGLLQLWVNDRIGAAVDWWKNS
jgi:hypothetical protein